MSKIIYGVHGTGHGHAVRALAVARHFPEHEFLFLTHGDGAALIRQEYQVVECPNPETPVVGHRVSPIAALTSNFRVRRHEKRHFRMILDLIAEFRPRAALADYEYFLPRACRRLGLPCLSLDHQHVVTMCRHNLPLKAWPSFLITYRAINGLFSQASDYLIISFYQPPLKPDVRALVLPPLLRPFVLEQSPTDGDHVLAYHGYATDKNFFDFLSAIPSQVIVYGSHVNRTEGRLIFKTNNEETFLDDLAGCRYVVCGGGHTLISEALYLGKPLIVFPIKYAFEQYLNAFYVEKLGYGRQFDLFHPPIQAIPAFEAKLDFFRTNIRRRNFYGNPEIFKCLDHYFQTGHFRANA